MTQVIGDNVSRAFSLVGALAIVRFRTVIRDTQDTAYVIFAVAVGMAAGAGHPPLAVSGNAVVRSSVVSCVVVSARFRPPPEYVLKVRLGLGHDPSSELGPTFDLFRLARTLTCKVTA